MIIFTRREMTRAWKQAVDASKVPIRTNAHRLLLFYAAECGLKAVYMKERNVEIFDSALGNELQHDLNRVMGKMGVGKEHFLPSNFRLSPIQLANHSTQSRNCACGEINQVWRYGGMLDAPKDIDIENALEKIITWIAKELK